MTKEEIEQAINSYTEVLNLMEKSEEELSVSQSIYLKYINCENVTKAAKEVRDTEKKMPNGNKVQPSHVSALLNSNPQDVPEGVMRIGKSIFKKNSRISYKINN